MMKKLVLTLVGLLGAATSLLAQVPTNSFVVRSDCPSTANNPSELLEVNTDGTLVPIGEIQTAGGTRLIINGLGYNQADRTALYGMQVTTPTLESFTSGVGPTLYRINLSTAVATAVGTLNPPAVPASGLTAPFPGESVLDARQTLNFVADSDPNGTYYIGGVTFRVLYQSFFGLPILPTARVRDVRLSVGTVNLNSISNPTWRLLDISDPSTAAVVEALRAEIEAFIRVVLTGPAPDGGIQDWVFDKQTGQLVSLLGETGQFLRIANPATAPAGVTTTPSIPIPAPSVPTSDLNIGSMFSDQFNNIYVGRASTGDIFRISNLTGNYTGLAFPGVLGCNRGDAVSFPDALPLPVGLVSFAARAQGAAVRLDWATAWERDVREFRVERRTDAQGPWQRISSVAATNAPQGRRYTALDQAPQPGINYYRLAIVDLDGTTAYSDVRSVVAANTLAANTVYPNPTQGEFTVELSSPATGSLQVVNSLGKVVREVPAQGQTVVKGALDGLPAGSYMLRTRTGQQPVTQRLVLMY